MSETHGEMGELVEAVAKAIFESTFDGSYDSLSEKGIDKAFARQQAIAALNAVSDFGDARFAHPVNSATLPTTSQAEKQ